MSKLEDQAARQIANIEEKTGVTLAEWVTRARAAPEQKHGKIVAYLKSEHGLTYGNANLIALKALASDAASHEPDDLVRAQYDGPKAGLKPIYDALTRAVLAFGDDVELAPKKAYVSVRRAKQLAILQPSTASRLDLGLNLKGQEPSGRLEAAGSWNTMCSHRVRLSAEAEVDAEVVAWLRAAYEAAG